MAGVPLTAGFIGKALIIFMAVQAQYYVLAGIAIAMAAVGFYYYFKVIRAMYWEKVPASAEPATVSLHPEFSFSVVLGMLIGGIFILGVYPLALNHLWHPSFFPAATIP